MVVEVHVVKGGSWNAKIYDPKEVLLRLAYVHGGCIDHDISLDV